MKGSEAGVTHLCWGGFLRDVAAQGKGVGPAGAGARRANEL